MAFTLTGVEGGKVSIAIGADVQFVLKGTQLLTQGAEFYASKSQDGNKFKKIKIYPAGSSTDSDDRIELIANADNLDTDNIGKTYWLVGKAGAAISSLEVLYIQK